MITWLRLAIGLGPFSKWALLFLGCLLGAGLMVAWTQRNPTALRWRLRLLYYPSAMGASFFALGEAVPALGSPLVDGMLLGWDRALFGETPAVWFQSWNGSWLNDFLMLGYLFFFYYLIMGPADYCVRDLPRFRQCIVGLFTLYGLGFLSYTLLPAGGPHRWMHFETPLNGPLVIPWTLATVNDGSNRVDVFPSLHFGVTFYLLVFDWWHRRRRFWLFAAPCLVMWSATVLLRFHYLVDLIGGLAVALIGLVVAWNFGHEAGEERVQSEKSRRARTD